MSADRGKVYENALTGEDILRARGASDKELARYREQREKWFLDPPKKKRPSTA
jgi:hypothetical protein